MRQPKRVWSNNKTVWDGKKSVWLQDWELKTYDWTWEKAEWQLSVYWNTWSNLSDDDELQVYDSSSATEIGTVEENQGDEPQPVPPTPEPESYTFTINVENLPEGASIDWEDFPMILDIPSWWSFNGCCNSHEGDGDLNVTIYDTPDWSSEWVPSDVNITCDGYKPLFEAVWFNLEDMGGWSYNFKKDDDYQIVPDSDVSITISFTPVENPAE